MPDNEAIVMTNNSGTVEVGHDVGQTQVRRQHDVVEAFAEHLERQELEDTEENTEESLEGSGEDVSEEGGEESIDRLTEGEEDTSAEIKRLGEYTPEKVAEWDAEYKTDGAFNLGRISAEWWDNKAKGKEGLDDATYDYLKAQGWSKEAVKQIETAVYAQTSATIADQYNKVVTAAGGADDLKAALAWGKGGGYTEDQRKRFDKVMSGNDLEAKLEATEALMARYRKANPPRRPDAPRRDATKGGGKPAGTPQAFKSVEEFRVAKKAARDNPQRLKEIIKQASKQGII